jgi:hypothetical protein
MKLKNIIYKHHKNYAIFIFIFCLITSYLFNAKITETFTQNLITLFSINIGFYMTSISIMYGSEYSKKLYNEDDPKNKGNTKLHTLKNYYSISLSWSLGCIVFLLIYMLLTNKITDEYLFISVEKWNVHFIEIDSDLVLKSFLLASSAVNVFFFWLTSKIILVGLINANEKDLC